MQTALIEAAKKRAAILAVDKLKAAHLLGVGTGSTVFYFIEELKKRSISLKAAFSSLNSHELLKHSLITAISNQDFISLDLTVDGADYIDERGVLIKGGGGALFREKILAYSSKRVLIIADETKLLKRSQTVKLPIEILPFGYQCTKAHLKEFKGNFRINPDGSLYLTDNQNYIFDALVEFPIQDPKKLHQNLKAIPGVVETGLFYDLPFELIVAPLDPKQPIKEWRV